ncbi:MAG TPA: hypothetical protein VFL99_00310 [Segeticoccus sp.]|nr:hypothetical protein [Segeticoccus sp.]
MGRLWSALHRPAPGVPRWARAAALLIPWLVLPASIWRIAGVGFHLPIMGDVEAGRGDVPGWLPMEVYVVLLSVGSELLAFAAVGLVATWGDRVPAWVPFLRKRRIPTPAAVVPAALGATVLTTLWTVSFVQIARGRTIQGDPLRGDFVFAHLSSWQGVLALAAYLPLLLWGPLLAAVTVSYWRRRTSEARHPVGPSPRVQAHGLTDNSGRSRNRRPRTGGLLRWASRVALTWASGYLVLGLAWLAGGPGYPWQGGGRLSRSVSIVDPLSPRTGALLVVAAATLGLLLLATTRWLGARPRPVLGRATAVIGGLLGLVVAVAVPDVRLLQGLGYAPMVWGGWALGLLDVSPLEAYPWAWWNLLLWAVGGLALLGVSVRAWRDAAGACRRCGRRPGRSEARTRHRALAVGRVAVAVAVAVPVGYAVTRYAWALGYPLGVRQHTLDDLGPGVWFGAGLATFGLLGAVLELGLVQPWGERFPRWMPRLAGRRVPVGIAVVPASVVALAVSSAGVMFIRLILSGEFDGLFPAELPDVAGWLPEMFWPVWGTALAVATAAYAVRRRPTCPACSDPSH